MKYNYEYDEILRQSITVCDYFVRQECVSVQICLPILMEDRQITSTLRNNYATGMDTQTFAIVDI